MGKTGGPGESNVLGPSLCRSEGGFRVAGRGPGGSRSASVDTPGSPRRGDVQEGFCKSGWSAAPTTDIPVVAGELRCTLPTLRDRDSGSSYTVSDPRLPILGVLAAPVSQGMRVVADATVLGIA